MNRIVDRKPDSKDADRRRRMMPISMAPVARRLQDDGLPVDAAVRTAESVVATAVEKGWSVLYWHDAACRQNGCCQGWNRACMEPGEETDDR